jgi:hypothetical protein
MSILLSYNNLFGGDMFANGLWWRQNLAEVKYPSVGKISPFFYDTFPGLLPALLLLQNKVRFNETNRHHTNHYTPVHSSDGPGRHELHIDPTEEVYEVTLNISLAS